jgi:ligand-binding sensor domain-containing protein
LFAQQPAYFILGEDQFRGVQIYDVIQDQELNYWIATDEGLYIYDYQNIKKVECDKSKSNSVFGFVINKEGTIYCHNLNYQIFQIKDKKFNLFHQLNSEENSSDISLSIADDDNLIIAARKIIALNKNGKVIQRFDMIDSYMGQPYTNKEGAIYYHVSGTDSVLVYAHKTVSKHKLLTTGNPIFVLKFYKLGTQEYAIDLASNKHYIFDSRKFELKTNAQIQVKVNQASRFYITGNNVLWIAGLVYGVNLLEQISGQISTTNFYKDYYISNVYQDKEGNYLLSTFDKGILVIPDLKIPELIQSFREDPITALYSDSSLGLLMGSSKGNIFKYQEGKRGFIHKQGKRSIEKIYGNPKSDLIIFDDGVIQVYNKKSKQTHQLVEQPLKDVSFVSEKEFYLGTNTGIYKCFQQQGGNISFQALDSVHYRAYSLVYNDEEKRLYAATSSGLFSIDGQGGRQQIEYNGEGIFPTGRLYYKNGRVYATERKYGILTLEKGSVIQAIRPELNGAQEVISKIIIKDQNIFAKTSNGLYQFDMKGKLIKSIQSIFGFSKKRVIDFTFHEGKLWVSHSGGLQQIDFHNYHANLLSPTIRISKLYINDTLQKLGEHVRLKSKERKISFELSSPTLRNRETIRYHYRLLGYDDKWNVNSYDLNTVTYNALAAGDYTFQVKAENQAKFSPLVAYSFSIARPYYTQWWFVVTMMILFVLIVLLIYRWQLRLQHKKSQQINELNTSKLTAIKSQMNPHFIFNSLNSIQDLILKGDVENSYSYITTFSNLVRRTLSHSEREFIDFEQEIKLLELYLSLEKLRFKKNLSYTISIKNVEEIMIPPLLIQPFIENALVHGLLHKEGDKKLTISFEVKDSLICTIEDNGVGRAKAKSIKQRQRIEYESFSGKAIKNRFEILSKIFEGEFGFVYEDLYENGVAKGTKVTLMIPIKYKF